MLSRQQLIFWSVNDLQNTQDKSVAYKKILHFVLLASSILAMTDLSREQLEAAMKRGDRLAFRLKEVSTLIGVPISTLRKMIHRKEINPVTAFGTWLISAEDLKDLLNRRLH